MHASCVTGDPAHRRLKFRVVSALQVITPAMLVWSYLAGTCTAQQRMAAGAAAGLTYQQSGGGALPYLGPGFGGSAVGGVAFVDRDLGDRVSAGGEVGFGAEVKGRQQQRVPRGSNDLRSRHRDTIFSAVLKVKAVNGRHALVAPMVGVGLAWRHTIRSGSFREFTPPFSTSPVEQVLSNHVFATTVGVDGAIVISPRVALLIAGRVHLLNDDDRDPSDVPIRGVGSTVVRIGGGARVRF